MLEELTMGNMPTRWARTLLAGLGATVLVPILTLATATTPARAATVPCTSRTTTTPFTAWNDGNSYFTEPGGTFESGTSGWTLKNARVVSGNEPWKVLSAGNAYSLQLAAAGSAAGPSMCIATAEDAMRVFYKAPSSTTSGLLVTIHVTSGVNVADNTYSIGGGANGWRLSDRIMLPDIRDASGQQTVTISFTQVGTGATWQIDDVEIDPWRSL
ncbi:MAG TPA: hypothetical protein VI248_16375 [Kineosporiaceae bacterium]